MKYFVVLSVLACLLAVVCASSYYAQAAKGSSRRSPAQARRPQPAKGGYDASGSAGAAAEEEHPAPEPYSFNYATDDGEAKIERSETGDQSGTITGQYSYMGPDGIFRTVTYTADATGFHPVITSNEPGLFDPNNENPRENPADAVYEAQNPPANAYDTPRKGGSKKRKSSRNY